jgi:hypothetical protein
MFKLYIFTVSLLIAFSSVQSLSNFIRGRLFNNKRLDKNLLRDIETQWYNQRLDHFNEALTSTWKQVYIFIFDFDFIKN